MREQLPDINISQNETFPTLFVSQTIFSGFWVRLGALVIDFFIIRFVLKLSALFLANFYYSLEQYGRIFGLIVFTIYLSVFDSKILGGTNPWKEDI